MGEQAVRVLLVSTHPVQYAVPLYRLYSRDRRLDVTVAYCSLHGARPGTDPGFGIEITWDVPLLDGYRWVHPPNRSPRPRLHGFFGLVNPGMFRLAARGDFDVVVCSGHRSASFWIAGIAARLRGAAVVVGSDAHTLRSLDNRRWKPWAKRRILPAVYRRTQGVLALSSATVTFLEGLGVPRRNIFLTPYVVDTEFFSRALAGVDRQAVRERWRVPAGAPVGVFVGKLVAWKRPGDLLEAGAEVEGLHIVYAGEGALRRSLEARSRERGMEHRVRFLGFVGQQDLPSVYAAADFLVLPSEYEAFGLVVNEAFACGTPAVVSTACGAVDDLVHEGETGFVVPVGDTARLTSALRVLAGDEELRRRMGEKARARIAEWGPEENAEAFADACLELAARKSARC